MLKEERQRRILDLLQGQGKIVAADLGAALNVSEATIQRDLRELAEGGHIQRVHGGALPRARLAAAHSDRRQQAASGKEKVGRAAAKLVRHGQVIIIDSGTTAVQVIRQLPIDLEATVITHSLTTAAALADYRSVEVILIGGTMHMEHMHAVGAETVRSYGLIRADLCLLGVWGLHPEVGISFSNFEGVQVKRAMIASADQVVALASAEKLGTVAPFVVAPASELTHLVTERTVSDTVLQPFRELDIEIIVG